MPESRLVLVCSCSGVGMDPPKEEPGTISVLRLDTATAQLEPLSGPLPCGRKTQWAVGCERMQTVYLLENDFEMAGLVKAYSIGAQGQLALLNEVLMGCWACHCVLDATERWLLVNDYGRSPGEAHVASFPILSDGSIGGAACRALCDPERAQDGPKMGQSPSRQEASHPHAVCLDTTNRFCLMPDLGQDLILVFAFEAETGQLTRLPTSAGARTHVGSGPRHMCFHPNGRWAFSVNELDSTVTPFAFEASDGRLTSGAAVSCLPRGFDTSQEGPWGGDGPPSHAAAITTCGDY
eukprot:SAG11_NODE_9228_length_931_cov_0.871394_1_plen_293_part_10